MAQTHDDLEQKTQEELISMANDLRVQLMKVQQKNRRLELEITETKSSQMEQQNQTEAEEEYIANTLFKRMKELGQAKSDLIRKVEIEEEYLTNTLQKKLAGLQHEKFNLERELENEEELIVNRLQKQLLDLQEEKGVLERIVEDNVELKIKKLELERLQNEKIKEISNLENENFGLKQQINKLNDQIKFLSSKNTQLESETEIHEEMTLNNGETLPSRLSIGTELPISGLHSGWLKKKSEKKFTDEFFVLTENTLSGFETCEGLSKSTQIDLDLVDKVLQKPPNEFELIVRGKSIQFQSSESVDKWVSLISEFIPNKH